jgi:hypothetical protein
MIRHQYKQVEILREKMIALALEKGSLLDEEVVAVSQQLDRELVMLQRLIMKKALIETKGHVRFVSFKFALQTPSRKSSPFASNR